ncbi:hypothetical protein V0N16_002790 [Salmonella enterica]|nr:hypothetical protein [Salmonella enterica]
MRNIKILISITVLTVSAYASASDLFTCKLPGGKVAKISFDGNKPTYIFGKADATPDVQLDSSKEWYMANNHYAGANYQVTFRVANGNYNYVLYSQNYGNGLDEGLVAYKGSKILYNKKCTEATNVDETVPFDASAATYGMQDEADTLSDFIGKLDKNGNNQRNDNSTQQSNQDREQTQTNQNPIEVRLAENTAWGTMSMVNITSLTNSVTINDVVVNRGNCTLFVSNQLKQYRQRTLKYGEQTKYGFNTDCNIREIVVKTNQGDWVFNN